MGQRSVLSATDMSDKTWFGQPRGLTILFLTQMWELFSYYGMRTLLVYYMTKELLFGQEKASLIYGLYTASAYFTPILGGLVADRWLGKRQAVLLGAGIMAIGHFAMAFESLFYPGLAIIALGNGLFLPSLPSQINDLYPANDPRRGQAYNVYYVGINVGGFLAPLVCGTLGEFYGWHWGFGAAGIGMVLGFFIYLFGARYLPAERVRPTPKAELTPRTTGPRIWLLLFGVGIAVTLFRGAYEQTGNTIPLWTDSDVSRTFGTFLIPMTWFQSLNSLLVIGMTPFLLRYWRSRANKGHVANPLSRMAFGAILVAVSFVLLAFSAQPGGSMSAHWIWLVIFYVVLTWGELYILPVGLGYFAQMAPPKLGATTVASWFLTIFSGSLFAGWIGTFWSKTSHANYFLMLAALAVFSAFVLMFLRKVSASPSTSVPPLHRSAR